MREIAAQAALEHAVGEWGTASLMAELELRETLSLKKWAELETAQAVRRPGSRASSWAASG